ncbi:MAG: hypothetical protein AAGB27_04355 [Pseudomonadota bacterium]
MNLAKDNRAISELWRSLPEGAGPKRPTVDLRARRRRQVQLLCIEVLVALGGISLAVALLLQGSLGLGLATLSYCLLVGVLGLRARRGNVAALDLSLAEQMQVTRAMLRARRNYDVASALIWVAALGYFFTLSMLRDQPLTLSGQLILAALLLAIGVQTWRAARSHRRWSAFARQADLLSESAS